MAANAFQSNMRSWDVSNIPCKSCDTSAIGGDDGERLFAGLERGLELSQSFLGGLKTLKLPIAERQKDPKTL